MLKPLVVLVHLVVLYLLGRLALSLNKKGLTSEFRGCILIIVLVAALALVTMARYEVCLVSF